MKSVREVIELEQQKPSALSGCIALALIGLTVWWCFIRSPSPEEEVKTTAPPTSSLRPSELKQHRQTFLEFESTISTHRARYNGCVSTWQKIFNDLSRNRI